MICSRKQKDGKFNYITGMYRSESNRFSPTEKYEKTIKYNINRIDTGKDRIRELEED